ncbi:MAG: cupin domain-containing protein [Christensenellales bacterium]|jgi:mannose-6-phosphate isomerase-like protein (cupin superfamily)
MSGNKITDLAQRKRFELRPGLVKTNLSYNEETMLCHFTVKKGSKIELHNHAAVQNGYVLKGRIKYQLADENRNIYEEGEIGPGGGYVWDAMEYHSTEALEDAEFVEFFAPMRPEYIVEEEN